MIPVVGNIVRWKGGKNKQGELLRIVFIDEDQETMGFRSLSDPSKHMTWSYYSESKIWSEPLTNEEVALFKLKQ